MDFARDMGTRLIFLVYFESLFLLKFYNLKFHLTKDEKWEPDGSRFCWANRVVTEFCNYFKLY